ncbi:hypothetical protein FHR75_004198 [Kineococcus radiotolerans]|uniref:Uncharacterized protein n=1 Tax=Kineococcus radiotolerans TaxID=131568 RepID=A0A7W4TRU6_KINRA|nr:hypothetical protein [Kineococcus radiotolerans]MBB2903356.1 hypothetical protein [Kineococcus radiotolerans]
MPADLVPATHLPAWYLTAGPGARGPVVLLTGADDDPRTAVNVERFVARHLHAQGWHVMRCEHPPIAHLHADLGGLMPPHPATRGLQLSPLDRPEHAIIYPDQLAEAAIARAHALVPHLYADRDHLPHVVQTYWERAAARSDLASEALGRCWATTTHSLRKSSAPAGCTRSSTSPTPPVSCG